MQKQENTTGFTSFILETRFFQPIVILVILTLAAISLASYFFPPITYVSLIKKNIISLSPSMFPISIPWLIWSMFILSMLIIYIVPYVFYTYILTKFSETENQLSARNKLFQLISKVQFKFLLQDSLTFIPFFVLSIYFLISDLFVRSPIDLLFIWALIFHFFLRERLHHKIRLAIFSYKGKIDEKLEKLPIWQWWLLIFVIFTIIFTAVAARFNYAYIGLEGDEPEYVMVTHSILQDHDIMVKNNYQRLEYRLFYRHPLPFGRTTWEGYPVEGIAMSIYLLPFYAIASHLKLPIVKILRFAVVPLAVLLMTEIFLLLFTITQRKKTSFVIASLCGLSIPIIFYTPLLFSEISGALLVALSVRAIISVKEKAFYAIIAPISISLLMWVGAKYVALAGPLMLWFFWEIWVKSFFFKHYKGFHREKVMQTRLLNPKNKIIFPIAFILLISLLIAYFTFLKVYYHSFSPLATRGGELLSFTRKEGSGLFASVLWLLGNRFDKLNYSLRVGIGYFFDQKVGLFTYSPFYMLLFPGFFLMIRKKLSSYIMLPSLFVIYWFMLFWLSYWEGYGPPVRYLVPVIPLIAVGLCEALIHLQNAWFVLKMTVPVTIASSILGFIKPHLLYHHTLWRYAATQNNFFNYFSGEKISLSALFPSFTKFPFEILPFVLWASIFVLFIFISFYKSNNQNRNNFLKIISSFIIIFIFIIFLFVFDPLPANLQTMPINNSSNQTIITKRAIQSYSWEKNSVWLRPGEWTEFYITSKKNEITVSTNIHSLVPNFILCRFDKREWKIKLPQEQKKRIIFKLKLLKSQKEKRTNSIFLRPLRGKNLFTSKENNDGRDLGVFITFLSSSQNEEQ